METSVADIPVWLKVAYTAFVAVTVPVYLKKYGPGNFLWFSDIALVLTVAALWMESAFIASMVLVGVLLPEILWNVSFFGRLLTGRRFTRMADYMFDDKLPRYLRALSLFHIFLPVLLLWLVARLGYDPTALIGQILLAWAVLPLAYLLTRPEDNVNWVYSFGVSSKPPRSPKAHLALLMVAFPVLVYLPTHFVLLAVFG